MSCPCVSFHNKLPESQRGPCSPQLGEAIQGEACRLEFDLSHYLFRISLRSYLETAGGLKERQVLSRCQ